MNMLNASKLVLTLATSVALPAAALGENVSQSMVQLDSGTVRGVSGAAVDRFLGIPYAQPPVGDRRWSDPLPATKWQGVRDASKAGAACYQTAPAAFGPYTREFLNGTDLSEDCLYLNVWRPHGGHAKLPVLVFIHGGAYNSGSGDVPIYDGAAMAGHGVVVVTINYRLGVFGFLAHPDLTHESAQKSSGNYGLLDQIAALRWVRANAAAFGGDPDSVVIAGQSAGAASVNNLLVAPQAKGLFKRAIAESGSGIGVYASPLAEAEQLGVRIERKLGVTSLAQMRAAPAADLLKAATAASAPTGPKFGLLKLPLAPNVDGVVLPVDASYPALAVVSPVPLLTGFNSEESGLFGAATNKAEFETMVRERYGAYAERFLALYPHGTDDEARASTALMGRDRSFASLVLWAQTRAATAGQAVYTYRFDHAYPATPDGKKHGVFHTSEVPYVSGMLNAEGRVFTAQDRAVSELMQQRWLAFIRTGNPSVPGHVWARSGAAPVVMELGDTFGPRPAVSSPERGALFREFVASGGLLSLF